MTKLFSLIIPVYNTSFTLSDCLDSIVEQLTENIEIICVDDGSTDSSIEILQKYSSKYKNILVFQKKNGGLSSARNYGLKVSSGKFIGFLDSDDLIKPDTVKTVLKIFEEDECDMVGWGTEVRYHSWHNLKKSDDEYFKIRFGRKTPVSPYLFNRIDVSAWNKAYKREILERHKITFPEGLWYEDAAFFWAYLSCCREVSFIQEKFSIYNRYPGSIMSLTFQRKSFKVMDHLAICEVIYRKLCMDQNIELYDKEFQKFFYVNYKQIFRYIPKGHRLKATVSCVKSLFKMRRLKHFEFIIWFSYRGFKKIMRFS